MDVRPPILDVDLPDRYEVSGLAAAEGMFGALARLLPEGSRLYLEGADDVEVQAFLEARAVAPGRTVPWGRAWPEPSAWHLPVDARVTGDLEHLARMRPVPKICEHLVAYHEDDVLVVGYDAFRGPLLLAPSLGEETVRAFCEGLGASYVRVPKPA